MFNSNKIDKQKHPVGIVVSQGDHILGFVFTRQGQRVSDLIMDDKPFFVVQAKSGVLIINKTHVVLVEAISPETFEAKRDMFPASEPQR